jgi:hypothetical protein
MGVRLALSALVLACLLDVTLDSQPPMESSRGTYPIPQVVGMSGECNARILATGVVDSADHEAQEGFAEINGVSVSVHRDGIPAVQLRELRGVRVDLMLRIVEPRELRKVER